MLDKQEVRFNNLDHDLKVTNTDMISGFWQDFINTMEFLVHTVEQI